MVRWWVMGGVLLLVSGVAWSLSGAQAQGERDELQATVEAQSTAITQLRSRVYTLEIRTEYGVMGDAHRPTVEAQATAIVELVRRVDGLELWREGVLASEARTPMSRETLMADAHDRPAEDVVTFSPTPEGGLGWLTIVEPVASCNIYPNPAATGGDPGAYFPGGPPEYLIYCP